MCIHKLHSAQSQVSHRHHKQMSNWGDPLHVVFCCSHLLLCPYQDLWTSFCAHWPSGTNTSQASPSHTPTVPVVQVCVSVFTRAFVCLSAEAQLCLNATTECQSISVVPVTHTAGLCFCVGTVSSMSVMMAICCLCNPHTETNWGFPDPHPLLHICQPFSPSICTSVFICPSVCIPLYLTLFSVASFDPLLATNRAVRHCTDQHSMLLSFCVWCETPWNKLIAFSTSWS